MENWRLGRNGNSFVDSIMVVSTPPKQITAHPLARPYRLVLEALQRGILSFVLLLSSLTSFSQVFIDVDTSRPEIRIATSFLARYLNEFKDNRKPDFTQYWSPQDLRRSRQPDDIVHAINSDDVTYNFSEKPTIFYARVKDDTVHLKTLFSSVDPSGNIIVWATTNHYVVTPPGNKSFFISELLLNKSRYLSATNGNINYHFPRTHSFNKRISDTMLARLHTIEALWSFQPEQISYYFADNRTDIERMRGLDYCFGMDGIAPSGIAFVDEKTIFCQGLGEGYLHEVLHIYFNPRYAKTSPLCHGLIYYLAGGLGKDFNWMIDRMNSYLKRYPDTDLSHFETVSTKDQWLLIDNVVKGLFCKMMDEREGIQGLKRLMSFTKMDQVYTEFKVDPKNLDSFLKESFTRYAGALQGKQKN